MFYNIHTHVYCNSQPRLFSHNKPNTYREIIKQFIRSHLGLLFIIPFCQVRTDFNNINPFGISLGIQCRRHSNICFYNMCIMVPTQWQKKSCNIKCYSFFFILYMHMSVSCWKKIDFWKKESTRSQFEMENYYQFYSNFPFRIGILCFLSFRSQFLFSRIHSCACTVLHNT